MMTVALLALLLVSIHDLACGSLVESQSRPGNEHFFLQASVGRTQYGVFYAPTLGEQQNPLVSEAEPPLQEQTRGPKGDGVNGRHQGQYTLSTPIDFQPPRNWVTPNYPLEVAPRNVIVPLKPEVLELQGEITIGTPRRGEPEQKVNVVIDTGSSLLWVLSKEACDKGPCNENRSPFDWRLSTSYVRDGSPLETKYHNKVKITGRAAVDHITLGKGRNRMVIKHQVFGEATEIAGKIFDMAEGILGLNFESPKSLRTDKEPDPPLYQMTKQFGTAPVFGLYLNKYNPKKNKLIFGDDGSECDFEVGEFQTHRVLMVNMEPCGIVYRGWNMAMDGFIVDGKNGRSVIPFPEGSFAQIDSGSPAIIIPSVFIEALRNSIFSHVEFPVTEDFSFSWDLPAFKIWSELPTVSIVLGGHEYPMHPHQYVGNVREKSTIIFMEAEINHVVLGRYFLEAFYTRFDFGNGLIHLAKVKSDPYPNPQLHEILRELGHI